MKLTSVTETYTQKEDCCGRVGETGQDIEISMENGGGGSYIVIKTERWAVDDINELVGSMKKLLARMHTAEKEKKK